MRLVLETPEGVDIEEHLDEDGVPLDSVPFFPYKVLNALVGIGVFMTVFAIIMFFFPEGGGYFIEMANFEEANPLVTPEHIAPVWYYSPYYAMLRAVPDKLGGLIVMGSAVAILFVVPWLDNSKAASIRYKGIYSKIALALFGISFLTLGYLGTVGVTEVRKTMSVICTIIYFAFFILMPVYTKFEKTKKSSRATMNKYILNINLIHFFTFVSLIFSINYLSSAEGGPCKDYGDCDKFKYSLNDMESLQRGASTFLNYCYGCHSLQYSRWGRVATDLQIPEDIFFDNLVFDKTIKAGDLMTGAMRDDESAQWFGVAPPESYP